MGWSLDMLKQVDCSMLIREVFSSFCNNSQACELRNKHIHIVRYSRGPLYLGEKRISISSRLGLCFYNDNDNAQQYEKHIIFYDQFMHATMLFCNTLARLVT